MRTIAIVVASACVLAAQSRNAEFMKAQQANSAALRHYTWKSRTELRLKGETKKVMLDHVRFDYDGQLQKTRIGGTPDEQKAGGRSGGPLKQRIVAKKIENFKEEMADLAALAASYGHLSPAKLQTFAQNASIRRGEGAWEGTIRIEGRDVLMPGDVMTVWIDPVTYLTKHVEIRTMFDADPVSLTADYRTVVGGPTYQAHAVLRYPDDGIEVIVENFDYEPAGGTR